MRRGIVAAIVVAGLLTLAGCTSERYAQNSKGRSQRVDTVAMMKKQDVVTLSKAGVSDSLIITMMIASNSWFDLKTQDVLELKNAGVSEKVINAMFESNEPVSDVNASGDGAYPPRYYWYGGYYPYWYYPSFSIGLGYRFYRPPYVRHVVIPRRSYFGGFYSHPRGGGRRR